jgi:hypothetical protein
MVEVLTDPVLLKYFHLSLKRTCSWGMFQFHTSRCRSIFFPVCQYFLSSFKTSRFWWYNIPFDAVWLFVKSSIVNFSKVPCNSSKYRMSLFCNSSAFREIHRPSNVTSDSLLSERSNYSTKSNCLGPLSCRKDISSRLLLESSHLIFLRIIFACSRVNYLLRGIYLSNSFDVYIKFSKRRFAKILIHKRPVYEMENSWTIGFAGYSETRKGFMRIC